MNIQSNKRKMTTYKGKLTMITTYLSAEALKTKKSRNVIFKP
jgi:hypothetical protein